MARTWILAQTILTFISTLSIGMPISRLVDRDGSLIEGDIIPFPEYSKRRVRGANTIIDQTINAEGTLWPNNTVYFEFDSTLDNHYRGIFSEAMRLIARQTCIVFERAADDAEAYLNLTTRHNECCSYVGMVGTVQDVSLGPGCSKVGNAIHELGHALGLYHEHTRSDRDMYINVNVENIEDGQEINFHINRKYQQNIIDSVDYDLGSVMHYKHLYFSKNGENTIDIKPDIYIPECISFGQRKKLTYKDALKINVLYQCTDYIEGLGDDDCVTTPPTTPPTSPPSTPTTPTPPPTCNKYFESGDEVFLKFGRNGDEVIQCSPDQRLGCSKSQCTIHSGCRDTKYRIHLAEDRGNRILRSGDEVVLEMIDSRSSRYAMACNRNESCLLETCPNNPPTNSPINSPSTEFCASQKMKIYGYNNKGKQARRLLDYHSIVFRAVDNNEKFLNCFDRTCKFYSHNMCDEGDDLSFSGQSSTTCAPQDFQLYHACSL